MLLIYHPLQLHERRNVARPSTRSDYERLRGSMSSLALRRACRSLSTQHVRGFTGASASKIPVAGARGLAGSSKITRIQESFFEPVRTHYPTIQQLAQLTLTAVSRICR